MSFDATFVALVGLVLFIALIMYLKVPAMIAKALDEKSAGIAKELAEARKLREEAEALLAQYEAKRAGAEAEAAAIVEHAKVQAAALVEETKAQMSANLARRQKQAEDRIAQAEAKAQTEVRAAAVDAAIAAAEKMLRDGVDAKTQSALVSQGVAELSRKFG